MESPLYISHGLASAFVIAGMLLTVVRLIRGPTLADRAVALDLVAVQGVLLLALHAIRTSDDFFVDVVLAVVGLSFVVLLGIARTIELREGRGDR